MVPGTIQPQQPPSFDRTSPGGWNANKVVLGGRGTVANVAFDMFVDDEPTKCGDPITAEVEIMIWVGTIGNPYPLKAKTLGTQKLGGRELYVCFFYVASWSLSSLASCTFLLRHPGFESRH
jgi:hypothetical protein